MFGIAAISRRLDRRIARRLSTWTRDYLRDAALADLGYAPVDVSLPSGSASLHLAAMEGSLGDE